MAETPLTGATSEAERRNLLVAAGHNLFRLPAAHVPYELFSDVPHDVLVPEAARQPHADPSPDAVREVLAPLVGDVPIALATKGRAAEHALVEALALAGPPVVLTHGLFTTTQGALARRAAVVEDLRLAREDGSADVDVDHLRERLARGGVQLVYLELANNALFGWPLAEANVAAVREACDRHGATLVLDAARPLANSAAVDAPDLVASARRILEHAHAFTISCAKEFLVPIGSVIGSRDPALIERASLLLFRAGTSMTLIDPAQPRADLRDGFRYALGHPELVRERLAVVRRLAAVLAGRGVPVAQPVTAHAVYIPIDRALVPPGDLAAMVSVLSHLYVIAGARTQIAHGRRGAAIRLAVPLRTSFDDRALATLADGIAAFLARLDERIPLQLVDGQFDVPYFRKLAPAR